VKPRGKAAKKVQAPTPKAEPTARTAAHRAYAVRRPTTSIDVHVSRAIDQELEWFFGYAEAALHRENVGMLPSYAVVRILATEPTDEAVRAKGHELARTVRTCLRALPVRHASVLRAAYTSRRWPRNVLKAFDSLSAIAVRLAFANDPWPERSSRGGLEEAAATQLSAALVNKTRVPVAQLRAQASRLFGSAIQAYLSVRTLGSPSLSSR
jgi:hypothetical protein